MACCLCARSRVRAAPALLAGRCVASPALGLIRRGAYTEASNNCTPWNYFNEHSDGAILLKTLVTIVCF